MTLEEANKRALAAAEAGDLKELADVLRARRDAIAELQREAPSTELAARMRHALQAGEAIGDALFRRKQRLGTESTRLARIADAYCGAGWQPARGCQPRKADR